MGRWEHPVLSPSQELRMLYSENGSWLIRGADFQIPGPWFHLWKQGLEKLPSVWDEC